MLIALAAIKFVSNRLFARPVMAGLADSDTLCPRPYIRHPIPDTQRAWPARASSNAKSSINCRTGAVIDQAKPSAMPGQKTFDMFAILYLAAGQLESLCKAPYLQRLLFVDISILRHAELAAFENCRAMGISAALSGSQFERPMLCRRMVTLGSERVLN